jgi:hypothetical protein
MHLLLLPPLLLNVTLAVVVVVTFVVQCSQIDLLISFPTALCKLKLTNLYKLRIKQAVVPFAICSIVVNSNVAIILMFAVAAAAVGSLL